MIFSCFLKGIYLAFYIVVPIGAISVLYIRRTLRKGLLSGIVSSFAVTTAEGFYAYGAIYGISLISDFLLQYRIILQTCGTVFLVIIGIKTFMAKPLKKVDIGKKNLAYDYFSMLFLTLANPMTIIGFVAVFAGFGAHNYGYDPLCSFFMLFGFIFLSISYCMFLVFFSNYLKSKFGVKDYDLFKMLNQVSGLVIIVFTLLSFSVGLVRYG
ncbi:MAG: hypothetical protein A2887_03770 [Alphaproteobacteria bacterium RIFCSPLOWO2_01_FULL_40_26]|nr:MAG: hypothetical protein A3D15_04925 [Alphaproteobacteria bacterium RIFCSPHIGHO2_02_FULL_40_34]OFW86476.1 MAG: hypothetical protein A2794_01430 [Alphaproteobacteria bacterium RIFCSPHIGHO2_01_FULL_40_8]OFW95316.1 MAG: hypothetical protein A2887_03770 [Alphaproteobacteria bacterium RIFCSPLOWO2_01_FULL_40_26]OFX09219.1 MAG: hypothetical protein A3H30_06475 [Alphaproteobacteria bacterium RIFCSPLOWO2_02_FULL_40_19]OFX11574.1 MAG: hypothetical protein A3G22_05080 [Alphaproteobacteria bacterium RI